MMIIRLWYYIKGYVIIIVEGYFLEKFINICIHRQIFLWDLKKHKNSNMTLKVSIKGFKMLKPVARKTKCRVRIKDKRGLPFVINRYKRRKMFLAGGILFLAFIFIMTSFVWTVEVSGNKKLEKQYIIDKLASNGVKPGIFKYNIDTDRLVNDIMLDINELSWIGVEVRGTKIKVEVREGVQPPRLIDKDTPCDVVAGKDGVISSVVVKAGQEKVKPGSTVTKGQMLISGSVENKNQDIQPRLVHAMGIVTARTWYEKNVPVETEIVERNRTGKSVKKYSLLFFNKRLNLFIKGDIFNNSDNDESIRQIHLAKDIVLPFGVITSNIYEIDIVRKSIEIDEAKNIATELAKKEITELIPDGAKVLKTSIDYIEKNDGSKYINIIAECEEDIGVTKEIGGK